MTLLNNPPENELYKIICKDISLFHFIQENALDGLFIYDLEKPDKIWMDPKLRVILGCKIDHNEGIGNLGDYIFKQDLQELKSKINKHQAANEYEFHPRLRFKDASGSTIWMESYFKFLNTDDSQVKLIAALKNVSARMKNLSLTKQIERYAHIIEGTNIGLWEWNIQTGETIFHEQWARVLGYTLDDLKPTSANTWKELSHPEERKKCDELLKEHLEGRTDFYECECRMKHKNGKWIWVEDKGKVVTWTEDGQPEWMTGFHEEITKIKEKLRLKKSFIEHAPSAIAMFDKQLNYIAVSNRWLENYHIQDIDVIDKNHYEIFPEIGDDWKKIHKRCLNGEMIEKEADHFVRQDGSEIWLNWEVRPWYDDENEIAGLIMHTADITHTKKIEKASKEKQHFLETILENINVGIISCDEKGQLTLFNETVKEWYGIPDKDVPHEEYSNYYGLYKKDGHTPLKLEEIPLIKALYNKPVNNEEVVIKPKNAPSKNVTVTGSQLKDENGKVSGAVVAIHNVTQRKEAEEKLNRAIAKMEAILGASTKTMIVGTDNNGTITFFNKGAEYLLGYSKNELLNKGNPGMFHSQDELVQLHQELLAKTNKSLQGFDLFKELVRQGESTRDWTLIKKDGTKFSVQLTITSIREGDETVGYLGVGADITKLKKTEENLRNSIAKMDAILRASTQTIIVGADTTGLLTFFNKGAENLLGYFSKEVVNKETPKLFHKKQELIELAERFAGTSIEEFKNFDLFAELTKNNRDYTQEWTFVKKDGSEFPVHLTITSIKENNNVIGYLGVGIDISQLKKAENELKSVLKVTQHQNERLKNFAHIVSHNLRSHSGNIEMLLNLFLEENPDVKEDEMMLHLNKASSNLKETIAHLNEVVLMNVSVSENLTSLKLKKYIDNAIENLRAVAAKNNVEIENTVPQSFRVLGIPAYLDSVILNFISNGIKYRSTRRQSSIKLRASRIPNYVLFEIEDNGMGIDLVKNRRKLFGMYKTFHSNKDARGIGLFITKNQVEAMGGKIDVESTLDKGTTFKIYLKDEKN